MVSWRGQAKPSKHDRARLLLCRAFHCSLLMINMPAPVLCVTLVKHAIAKISVCMMIPSINTLVP